MLEILLSADEECINTSFAYTFRDFYVAYRCKFAPPNFGGL